MLGHAMGAVSPFPTAATCRTTFRPEPLQWWIAVIPYASVFLLLRFDLVQHGLWCDVSLDFL